MSTEAKNTTPPALKHGAYSTTAILPGEDATAFDALHQDLIADFAPAGRLEEDVVATIARLAWRKHNFVIFRSAELARQRCEAGATQAQRGTSWQSELRAAQHSVSTSEQAGESLTIDRLSKDLEIEERIDGMIDKCLKRLLFLRGLKSLPVAAPRPAPQQRIPRPTKAA